MDRRLTYPILLSVLAALLTLGLKAAAYGLTGSVGLLSDAAESLVNLLAALAALAALAYAARPVDRDHAFGHQKIEFFASALEGGLILAAALAIGWTAAERLAAPRLRLDTLGWGLGLSLAAALINGGAAWVLLRAGRKHHSIVLEADGQHLLADVWTSGGVLLGLGLAWLTGWAWLDPVLALLVAVNILWTAWGLVKRSFDGLMDRALPDSELAALRGAIEARLGPDMAFHALRTRRAGARRFVDFHLLVPGDYTVRRAHAVGEEVEAAVRELFPGAEVTVHIEPIEERGSWEDSALLPLEHAQRPR
jgi:cation diffusion facilitator family transporter